MAGHRLRCTAVFLLLALVSAGTEDAAVGAAADAYAQLESSAPHPTMQPPNTQLLTPFAGGDDGWERMSITSSVDRMMGNVEDDSEDNDYVDDNFDSDDFSDVDDDGEDGASREEKEDDEDGDEDNWDSEENTFDYAPITSEEDPLIAEVLPESIKRHNREKANAAARAKAAASKPSTAMMDNPLINAKLKKQIKQEMGEPVSKSQEQADIERDVTKVLMGEKSHTMELEKELAKAKAQAAEAKKRQRSLERALRQAATTNVKKKAANDARRKREQKMSKEEKKFSHMVITDKKGDPLALKKEDAGNLAETGRRRKQSKDPIKAIKKVAKSAKKAAKKAKAVAKKAKKAAKKKVPKKSKKAAKKAVAKKKKADAKKAVKKEEKKAVKAVKKMKAKKAKKAEKAEVKKLLHKAKKNVKKAKKVQTKTQKRLAHWASNQVIDDPEDAVKNFKNRAQEKIHKKRVNGDGRNHSGHWANKYDYYTDGYISNNAYLDKYGHYHLGMSRRRIGAGFGRRRRGTGFTPGKWVGRVHSRMLRKIVKGHSLLREGLKVHKGERNIYGKAPRHPRKKKKLPPGIEEADKHKLTPAMKEALKKSGAGLDAEVDKHAHFLGKTIVKIGGKSLAHSLGDKVKAAKKTAKLAAKVHSMVSNALKGVASKAAGKSYSSGGHKGKNAAKAAIAKAVSAAKVAKKIEKKAFKSSYSSRL